MAMPKIQFTTNGANSLIGGFAAGDLLSCADALARHLVEEAKCARYVVPAGEASAGAALSPAPKKSTGRRKHSATQKRTQEPKP